MGEFRIGIDPGERYVGLALVEIDGEKARALALVTVDLQGTGAKKALKHLLAGRSAHRRLRRSLKTHRRRLKLIRSLLADAGASDADMRIALGLCQHRGWRSDFGRYDSPEKVLDRLDWKRWHAMSEAAQQRVWAALAEVRGTNPESFARHRENARKLAGISPSDFETRASDAPDDDEEYAIRVPRRQAVDAIDRLISRRAPSIPEWARFKIRRILERPPRAHGLQNKRVANCSAVIATEASSKRRAAEREPKNGADTGEFAVCKRKRCRGVDYPALWLGHSILNQLPRADGRREDAPAFREVRREFLKLLRKEGLPIDDPGRDAAFFRRRSADERENDLKKVRKAWEKAVKEAWPASETPEHEKVKENKENIDNIGKFLKDAQSQIRGSSGASRLAFCPIHLRESVLRLTRGQDPLLGGGRGRMHSLTWEAVAGKIGAYVRRKLLPRLPDDGRIDQIVIERAAFDLIFLGKAGRKASRKEIPDPVRWLGPYGQLRSLAKEDTGGTNELLALELGGLCAVCGEPLGSNIDRAHLLPKEEVGGYPYLSVVATHPEHNQPMGKRMLLVNEKALEELRKTRDELKSRHGMVHAWINAKYGILKLLSQKDADEARVRKYLGRAFTTREATMQSADILGEAVREAVRKAGRGEPEVRKRGAAEVAGARWMACTPPDGEDPWFVKATAKKGGEQTNHAMDAFIVAALPDPEWVGRQRGRSLFSFDRRKAVKRLEVLASPEKWEAVLRENWQGKEGLQALGIMELTVRRIWAQAFMRDTQIRARSGEKGEYRISAEQWLENLKEKAKNKNKVLGHIQSLRFEPLRRVAEKAANTASDDLYAEVRKAVVNYLKASTLAGLRGGLRNVFLEHPVNARRRKQLEEWASSGDVEAAVPVWVGVLVEDRWSGGRPVRIRGRLSRFNLESWALASGRKAAGVEIEAHSKDGAVAKYLLELDGSLRPLDGAPQFKEDDSNRLKALLEKSRPVMGPYLREWRKELIRILSEAGFVKAFVVDIHSGNSLPVSLSPR